MKNVTVYSTLACPYCNAAKALLDKRGISYEEINMAGDPDAREKLEKATGNFTFPQIVIDGEVIGGFDELRAADRGGQLASLGTAA